MISHSYPLKELIETSDKQDQHEGHEDTDCAEDVDVVLPAVFLRWLGCVHYCCCFGEVIDGKAEFSEVGWNLEKEVWGVHRVATYR